MSIGKVLVGIIIVSWAAGAAAIIAEHADKKRKEDKNV